MWFYSFFVSFLVVKSVEANRFGARTRVLLPPHVLVSVQKQDGGIRARWELLLPPPAWSIRRLDFLFSFSATSSRKKIKKSISRNFFSFSIIYGAHTLLTILLVGPKFGLHLISRVTIQKKIVIVVVHFVPRKWRWFPSLSLRNRLHRAWWAFPPRQECVCVATRGEEDSTHRESIT